MLYKIGDLSKLTGCKVVTIRYYEKEGFLHKPTRSNGNYRLYNDDDVDRLKFIRHCRSHGISLGEIRTLLEYRDSPDKDCSEVNKLLDRHLETIEENIQSLIELKERLSLLRQQCRGVHNAASCGIMRGLADVTVCGCCPSLECGSKLSTPPPAA